MEEKLTKLQLILDEPACLDDMQNAHVFLENGVLARAGSICPLETTIINYMAVAS